MSIPSYRDIVDLVKTGLTIEAQEKIMELRVSALELQEDNFKLREKIAALEAELKNEKNITFDGTVYRLGGDAVPFCTLCKDRDQKLIHLRKQNQQWCCQICYEVYNIET